MSRDRLRVVVTGLAATYPFGGVFWDYVQYPLGLLRLGHDVLYVEDNGRWCYDPSAATFVPGGARNAAALAEGLAALDPALAHRWFFRDSTGATYGRTWRETAEFCRSADLFVHISASCILRDEYRAATRLAFIDSDPMYTQASVPAYLAGELEEAEAARVEMLRAHDAYFTFGENVGRPGCRIPTGLFDWTPTRQPVILDAFDPAAVAVAHRRRVLTTVASWEPTEKGPVVDGVAYRGKSAEFLRLIDLPRRTALPVEVALSGSAPADRLRDHGWILRDGYEVSRDPWVYRDYLARSFGELGIAKNAYVASRSGWFSCRSACYLALGVPVVAQDTGFSSVLPTGRGLLAFRTAEEAADAVDDLARDPDGHARAAREIAAEYFAADKVLTGLIDASCRSRSRETCGPRGGRT